MPSATDGLEIFFYCAVACDCLRFVVMVNEYRINAKLLRKFRYDGNRICMAHNQGAAAPL